MHPPKTVGRLHRDLHRLSSQDLELAKDFVDLLIQKRTAPKDEK